MAWVAVDASSDEYIFKNKPKRNNNWWVDPIYESFDGLGDLEYYYNSDIKLPKGSIRKLIGRDITWEDNPVELKEE